MLLAIINQLTLPRRFLNVPFIAMQIRIAFFLPHFRAGGIERIVLNLLQQLDPREYVSFLILMKASGELLEQIPDTVKVIDLTGVRTRHIVPLLRRTIYKLQLDIVYSGTNNANLALLASQIFTQNRPRLIISEHTPPRQYVAEMPFPLIRSLAMRALYPYADRIIVPLLPIGKELCALLNNKHLAIEELPNPVLANNNQVAEETTEQELIPTGVPLFIAVGRLVYAKGFDLLIEAFAHVLRHHETARLVILGEGPLRHSLEKQAKTLGVDKQIALPGCVQYVQSYLQNASALVVSSRREGFGNAIIEAMAVNTPVVAFDCPCSPTHLLKGGQAGLLAKNGDVKSLAQEMENILNPDIRERFLGLGPPIAAQFEVDRAVPRYTRLFTELVKP